MIAASPSFCEADLRLKRYCLKTVHMKTDYNEAVESGNRHGFAVYQKSRNRIRAWLARRADRDRRDFDETCAREAARENSR